MIKQDNWALFHKVVDLLEHGFSANEIEEMHPELAPALVRNTVQSVLAWQKRNAESRAAATADGEG